MARTSILGSVAVKLGLQSKGFDKSIRQAELSLKRFGKSAEQMGRTLSVSVTAPLIAGAAKSIQLFDKQAKAIAQVEQGLKSTGNAAGFSSKQLQDMASGLQGITVFGDEDILANVTAQLLTFTNISGEAFARTQQAALDLATRLDGDLKSASIQLGKALNDPVANLSALSRSGIQFSEQQKEVIKDLANTNRLADAQAIILNELEKQYGGSAEAARKAGIGGLQALNNSFGDLLERIGKALLPTLNKLVSFLDGLVAKLNSMSDAQIAFNVAIAGMAAAAGPALLMIGKISKAVLALNTPLGAALALFSVIALYVVNNWDKVSKQIIDVANKMITLYNESADVRTMFEGVAAIGSTAFSVLAESLDSFMEKFISSLGVITKTLQGDFKGAMADAKTYMGLMSDTFSNLWKTSMKEANEAIDNVSNRKVKLIDENYLNNSLQNVKKMLADAMGFSTTPASEEEGEKGSGLIKVDPVGFEKVAKANKEIVMGFQQIQTTAPAAIESMKPEMIENLTLLANGLAFGFDQMGESLGRAFGDSIVGINNFKDAFKGLGQTFKQVISQMIAQMVKLLAMRGIGLLLGAAGVPVGVLASFGLPTGGGLFGFGKDTSPAGKMAASGVAGKASLNANLYIDGQGVRTTLDVANRRINRITGG